VSGERPASANGTHSGPLVTPFVVAVPPAGQKGTPQGRTPLRKHLEPLWRLYPKVWRQECTPRQRL